MNVFTVEAREELKSAVLQLARRDSRVSAAAVTGSAAVGLEDRWSDIDVALGVADPDELPSALSDFSSYLYSRGALHHHDLVFGAWTYRVFFLPGGLQVDLAFVVGSEFRPLGPAFQLAFGEAGPASAPPEPNPRDLVSMAWLHALHARSSIARGRPWQAEHMIRAVRDYTLMLACVRMGLPSAHGRGLDSLPDAMTRPLLASLVRSLDADELRRAFGAALEGLASEVRHADPELGTRVSVEILGLAA